MRKMTPFSERKLPLIHRAVSICEYESTLCSSTLAAGRSHQSQFHANPVYGWLPCKEALKCLWGSGEPRKCRSGCTFPSSPSFSPPLALYCSLSLPKGRENHWKTPLQTFMLNISLEIKEWLVPVMHSVELLRPCKINTYYSCCKWFILMSYYSVWSVVHVSPISAHAVEEKIIFSGIPAHFIQSGQRTP